MTKKILLLTFVGCFSFLLSAQHKDYYAEGNIYMNQKKFALAEETYALGIDADSSLHILYPSLANAMMMQGKHNPADSVLDVILKKHPKYLGALWYKGINYFKWGQDSMCIVYMKQYLAKANVNNNQVIEGYYYVGRAYEIKLRKTGLTQTELSEMIAYYEKFISRSEGHPVATSKKVFISKVKAKRPLNYKGRWVYKEPVKK